MDHDVAGGISTVRPEEIYTNTLAPLLRVNELSVSKLGQETSYPDRGFEYINSVPPDKYWNSILK
jgi:hypothetical protein